MNQLLDVNPRYNGAHSCPSCGTLSHWTCVNNSPIVINVSCDGKCGSFEKRFSELELMDHFEKPVERLVAK